MYTIFIILIVIVIVLNILIILWYKIKYPFWNKLNAFHNYKWWYWFYRNQIFNNNKLTRESKYYNTNYLTKPLNDIKDGDLDNIVVFINKYFMNYTDAVYSISEKQLSIIKSKQTFITYNNIDDGIDDGIDGCILSMPFFMWCKGLEHSFGKKYKNNINSFIPIHYVDYLCVHKNQRRKNKASKLIYTHLLNTTNFVSNNKTIPFFLFKNEGFKTRALKPIVEYNGYVINLENTTLENCNINFNILKNDSCSCVQIDPSNTKLLNDCITILYNLDEMERCGFKFITLFTKEILINHIKNKEIIVYCLMANNIITGLYFFKNIHSLINNKTYEFVCCGSLNLSNKTGKSFVYAFKIACVLCKNYLNHAGENESNTYSYDLCCIEEVSHNYEIIRSVGINTIQKYAYKIPIAYYNYNGIIHKQNPKNVFVLS